MSFLEKVDYPDSATKEYSKKFLQFIFLKSFGILLFILSFFILLSVATYSKNDPSFRNANDGEIANLLGKFGSYLADSLHVAIGVTMLTLPVFLLAWSSRFLFSSSPTYLFKRIWIKAKYEIPSKYWYLNGIGGIIVFYISLLSIYKTYTGNGWTWKGRNLSKG